MDAPDLNCIQFFRLISINRRGLLPGALCRSPNTMSGVRSKKPISFFQLIPHLQCCKQMNCCFILRPQFGQVLLLFPIALNVQTVFVQQKPLLQMKSISNCLRMLFPFSLVPYCTITLYRRINVFLSLHIISNCAVDQEGITEIINIPLDCRIADLLFLNRSKCR